MARMGDRKKYSGPGAYSPLRLVARFAGTTKTVKAGVGVVLFFVALALLGLVYLPNSPLASVGGSYLPPSTRFPFGTTSTGQDIFSQWIYAAQPTLMVGLLAAAIGTLLGVVVGIAAGFVTYLDEPLMRLADVVLALPTLPLLIVVAAFIRPSLFSVALLIALLSWAGVARVLRSSVLSLKHSPYVEVAMLSRVPRYRIMMVDMFKHTLPLILSYSLFAIGDAILSEASLDFIGVGPISANSWGAMISLSQSNNALLNGAWWWTAVPGLSIATLITGFALIAYGLEAMFKQT
jgi:peptide/nickel transport system permease protein